MSIWHVYRHCAADGEVLYIGCSTDLKRRTTQHSSAASWWPRVASVECFAEFDSLELGREFETMSIYQAQPKYNVVHAGDCPRWAVDIAARRGDIWYLYGSVQRQALTLEPNHTITLRLEVSEASA